MFVCNYIPNVCTNICIYIYNMVWQNELYYVYVYILYIIGYYDQMCASSPRNVRTVPYRYQTDREGGKRWTPFIIVFGHHLLRVCFAFPFSSSLERPYGLYIPAVCSQGIEIYYVRHMAHDIRCMNACEYRVILYTFRKKKSSTR